MGHGVKPPGHYIQHSFGLFPAPWPQNSPSLSAVVKVMDLLGMFVAKCIQDGRRVDLPLSTSFFKLMCTPGLTDGSSKESLEGGDSSSSSSPLIPEGWPSFFSDASELLKDNDDDQESNRQFDRSLDNCSNQRLESSLENNSEAASRQQRSLHGEAGLKEAELVLSTHADEISKDGSPKEDVITVEGEQQSWFKGILSREDLERVSPHRSRFLQQLRLLAKERDEVQASEQLGSLERERQLAALTLPGSEKNVPGAKLEDLW